MAIDIDGTLGNYHDHFILFAQEYLGVQLQWSYSGVGEFSDSLELTKKTYQEIKLAYRQGGMKRTMPPFPDAARFVNHLRDSGIEIWITTTRPYLRLDNIDPDTRHWLERHHIKYDGLLFNEDKYEVLVEIVDPNRVLMVVDDQPGKLDSAVTLGLPTLLRHTRWNADAGGSHNRVHAFDVMSNLIIERLDEWREKYDDRSD